MTQIILFFSAGIILLATDVFLFSVILAVIGGAAMFVGVGLVYHQFGALDAVVAGMIALGLLSGTVYLELVVLPRTRLGRGLIVHSTSGSNQPLPAVPGEVIGKTAEAMTTLAPSGYVLVDGRRFEAFCQTGHAPAGAMLQVVGLDNFRLIVTNP
jgi:membrane-bound ClpP family serine protease